MYYSTFTLILITLISSNLGGKIPSENKSESEEDGKAVGLYYDTDLVTELNADNLKDQGKLINALFLNLNNI